MAFPYKPVAKLPFKHGALFDVSRGLLYSCLGRSSRKRVVLYLKIDFLYQEFLNRHISEENRPLLTLRTSRSYMLPFIDSQFSLSHSARVSRAAACERRIPPTKEALFSVHNCSLLCPLSSFSKYTSPMFQYKDYSSRPTKHCEPALSSLPHIISVPLPILASPASSAPLSHSHLHINLHRTASSHKR